MTLMLNLGHDPAASVGKKGDIADSWQRQIKTDDIPFTPLPVPDSSLYFARPPTSTMGGGPWKEVGFVRAAATSLGPATR
jgi:hypothetical protein